eukprot:CAMPEP_0181188768 /NCGR_PEP_ID=MMETSP1096-20121128/11299_1 /TAXON_ID=156174 ORGANISM="Chrysochromulina ericina, Strain CCMP281" /NCGR_SAMPLE_ID=MMETSP1096 /ASSEMBLY_ACC=CAM_ASM_000453 /LENGTH=65 /DNA_ID=CAMNT_0023277865 /DNA_START=526 /DNA_END=723 /DNA_ORIENTATION=-
MASRNLVGAVKGDPCLVEIAEHRNLSHRRPTTSDGIDRADLWRRAITAVIVVASKLKRGAEPSHE